MFTYESPKSRKSRSIDLNAQACLQARIVDGMTWNDIGQGMFKHGQDANQRAVQFGTKCNVANLMDVRTTPEWETEVHKFAAENGHDLNICLQKAMSTARGSNGNGSTAPTATAVALPTVSESELAVTLRKLEARAKETDLLARIASEDLALKTKHYTEESELLETHIQAVKTLQAELQAAEAAAAETESEEVETETEEDLTEVCEAIYNAPDTEEEVNETESEDIETAPSEEDTEEYPNTESAPDTPEEEVIESSEEDTETESEEAIIEAEEGSLLTMDGPEDAQAMLTLTEESTEDADANTAETETDTETESAPDTDAELSRLRRQVAREGSPAVKAMLERKIAELQ